MKNRAVRAWHETSVPCWAQCFWSGLHTSSCTAHSERNTRAESKHKNSPSLAWRKQPSEIRGQNRKSLRVRVVIVPMHFREE